MRASRLWPAVVISLRQLVEALCVSVCVCDCVCISVFLSVCYYCFFSDCRIYLFSSLAARVFNKLTRYSLGLSSKHLLSLSHLHFCSNAEKRSLNGSRLPPMVLPVEEKATPTRIRRSATRNKSTVTKLLHTKSTVPLYPCLYVLPFINGYRRSSDTFIA